MGAGLVHKSVFSVIVRLCQLAFVHMSCSSRMLGAEVRESSG